MPISADQARDIAKAFLELSHDLGSYRFANLAKIPPEQRQQIEEAEFDLLNHANSFVTIAVGIALADMQSDLMTITNATAQARQAIATIETVQDVLDVAATLVTLGGAIASQNPAAIVSAARNVLQVAENVLNKRNG